MRRDTGLAFTVAILVAACGGGLRMTGADARVANPDEASTVGEVGLDAATTRDEAQDTITGIDACINIIAGDTCVEGEVPCPLECMQCLRWECTDGGWVLSRFCLSMCP